MLARRKASGASQRNSLRSSYLSAMGGGRETWPVWPNLTWRCYPVPAQHGFCTTWRADCTSPAKEAITALAGTIGPKLLDLRQGADLSHERLADAAGLSANYVSLIEKGRRLPSLEVLSRLAHALGVPVTAFFDEEVPKGAFERELWRLTAYLRQRQAKDVRKLYSIARLVFA